MLQSYEQFHSANGKRKVLVIDDEAVNRELMAMVLQDDYDVICAENGEQAVEIILEQGDTISLILLDLIMPVMSGREVLHWLRKNACGDSVPVIVLTADLGAEAEILQLGAADFIPKPYPDVEIIKARILRTIELFESRDTILNTERDPLTGLYNRDFFYRYASQYDLHNKDLDMDAIVVDVSHFHMINERFGTPSGDEVLMLVADKLREIMGETSVMCRIEADTFMVYCPHGYDYKKVLRDISASLEEGSTLDFHVRLRMGVYPSVDKTLDMSRRFDRAKMAADTVRNNFAQNVGIYDNSLHERELFAERLINDFPLAIEERQFEVYYQPKFDIHPEIPVLAGAEALVRWFHPELGTINPGDFIPLFEENGLIHRLDEYVWRSAAAQIADWRNRFGFTVPVSVNVSRIDLFDPAFIDKIMGIVSDNGLTPAELHLEITESAYTQNSAQIVTTVKDLRELGFHIEMDDFGTGYSSLGMISELPIDALKLDMQFIRAAFDGRRDVRMIEAVIDIAEYLSVPVIAEGVETEEQLDALRTLGCQLVQGYYFSKPVSADEYEHFVEERKEQRETDVLASDDIALEMETPEQREEAIDDITFALSSGFERVYYVDANNGHYVEFSSKGSFEDLQMERSGTDFFNDALKQVQTKVHATERVLVSMCLQRSTLMEQLLGNRPFSVTFREVAEGEESHYALKAVRANPEDDRHIVIGISKVD